MDKIFGIVEGFFSRPLRIWNFNERISLLNFIGKNCININTYFYCPKDDPYLNKEYKKNYPQKEILHFKKLINLAKTYNINFIFGLNPTLNLEEIEENEKNYIKDILRKLKQLEDIGVKNFCILYDDIPLAYDILDNKKNNKERKLGQVQAKVLNILYKELKNKGLSLNFCPSDYFYKEKTDYLDALFKDLDKEIPLIWSGPTVWVKKLKEKDFKLAKSITNDRKLIWWDNYPVNDDQHAKGRFHIGAYKAPEKEVTNSLEGILINPMREPYANYIAILTFNDSIKNLSFDRTKSTKEAFKKIFGESSDAASRIFLSFSSQNILDSKPRGYRKKILATDNKKELEKILSGIKNDLETLALKEFSIEGENFIKDTKRIINLTKAYLTICKNILNEKTWEKEFNSIDMFPIILNKRYKGKIITNILKRTRMLGRPLSSKEKTGLEAFEIESLIQTLSKEFISSQKDKKELEKIKNITNWLFLNEY